MHHVWDMIPIRAEIPYLESVWRKSDDEIHPCRVALFACDWRKIDARRGPYTLAYICLEVSLGAWGLIAWEHPFRIGFETPSKTAEVYLQPSNHRRLLAQVDL